MNNALVIYKIEDEENAYSLYLPKDTNYTMTISGWIYSQLHKKQYEDTLVYVETNVGYQLIGQFSLSNLGAIPHLVARGKHAYDALNTVINAFTNFNPDDFDSDGYYIKKEEK